MPFTINRTVAVALTMFAFLAFSPSRVLFAAPRTIEDAETPPSAESDDADCEEFKAFKAAFLELKAYPSDLIIVGSDLKIEEPEKKYEELFDAALLAGDKNPQAAEKIVDFVTGSLYFHDRLFFRFCEKIRKAGENESSPFHQDELLEKVSYSVKYEYFMYFDETYEAEGVAGLEKVLDRYAQDVQKNPRYLAFYKIFDDLLTRPEDDEWKNYVFDEQLKQSLDDDSEGYGRPELGLRLKRIVVDAYLRELRSNPDLVPMPIDDFLNLFGAVKGADDAEFIDQLTSIWLVVAFASDHKLRRLDYQRAVNLVENRLFSLSEETASAFTERAVASLKVADSVDENTAARLVLWGFYLKMKKAADEGDAEGFDNVVADLVEWEKDCDSRAVRGGFDFAAEPAELVFDRYSRKIRDFVESEDFEKLEETIAEIVALEKMFPSGALSPRVEAIMRELEVVRPDLAFQVYDEARRTCREPLNGFYMQTAAFYCESIDAILDADLEKLEKLADKLAERANKSAKIQLTRVDRSHGQPMRVLDIETDYLYYQRQTYAWKFHVHYGDSREAFEFLDRAISALEKSDKPNAKLFRELLIDVRNDPNIPDRDRRHFEQNATSSL